MAMLLLVSSLAMFTDFVRDDDNLKIELRSNISYVVDGDTVDTVSVKNNYNFKLPTIPEKVGYIIAGWESSLTDSSRTGEHSVGKQLQAIEDEVWTAKYVSLYTYTHAGTNQVSVTGFNPDVLAYLQTYPANIEFPAVVDWNDGRLVTGVSSSAFAGSSVQSVKFGENMTSVGNESFKGSQLTEVDLSSLDSIGAEAFADNKLTHVDLPSTVATVGRSAFSDNLIKTINIANGVSTISNSAFARNAIEELVLPSSVTSIGDYAFLGNSLTEVTIADTLNSIGIQAFHGNVGGEVYANVKSGDLGDRWAPTFRGYKFESSWKHGQGLVKVEFKDALGATYHEAWQQPGLAPTPPADPTRTGYTFDGWDPAVGSAVTVDTVFTPTWKINQYTLTFNSNGGSTVASKTQDYGSSVTAPVNTTRTGYTFAGWSPAVPSTMPAANSTHTAQWTINTYAVTVNPNGGQFNGSTSTKVITSDYLVNSAFRRPTRTGYTFTGWTESGSGTITPYGMHIPTRTDSELSNYSYWMDKVTVYNNSKDGSIIKEEITGTNPYDNSNKFLRITSTGKTQSPGRGGFVFNTVSQADKVYYHVIIAKLPVGTSLNDYRNSIGVGGLSTWLTSKNGTGEMETYIYRVNTGSSGSFSTFGHVAANGGPDTLSWDLYYTHVFEATDATIANSDMFAFNHTGNKTVTAQWEINKYTATFNSNGGSAVAPQSVNYNSTVTAPANPTRTGYTFVRWSPALTTPMTQDTTFNAIWTINTYAVTFNANSGTGAPGSQTKTYGTALTLSSTVPTRTGYTFSGWNTAANGTGTSYAPGASYTANSVVTLYAQWTIKNYTVQFNLNGGTSTKPANQTVNHGSKATVPTAPKRAGYVFKGWSPAISTTITGNTTFTAQWEEQTVVIKYWDYYYDYLYGDPAYKTVTLKGNQTHVIEKINLSDTSLESLTNPGTYYQVGQVISINKNSGRHENIYLAPVYSRN